MGVVAFVCERAQKFEEKLGNDPLYIFMKISDETESRPTISGLKRSVIFLDNAESSVLTIL